MREVLNDTAEGLKRRRDSGSRMIPMNFASGKRIRQTAIFLLITTWVAILSAFLGSADAGNIIDHQIAPLVDVRTKVFFGEIADHPGFSPEDIDDKEWQNNAPELTFKEKMKKFKAKEVWYRIESLPLDIEDLEQPTLYISALFTMGTVLTAVLCTKTRSGSLFRLLGFCAFLITTSIEMLNRLGIITWGNSFFSFGIVILVITFGQALMFQYRLTRRDVVYLGKEVNEAKNRILEIKQENLQARFSA